MTGTGTVHMIVPDAIDDPVRPSGGNRYDRRICAGLAETGWQVRLHPVPDAWPQLGAAGLQATASTIANLPDRALVLVDGLIASAAANAMVPAAGRLSIVVLLHMSLGDDRATRAAEGAVLGSAAAVIATSGWARQRLLARYPLPDHAVHVAEPGVDRAPRAVGTADGSRLLCVGAVTPQKGHDLLLAALAALADHPWRCEWVGPLDRDLAYVARLRHNLKAPSLAGRVRLTGPLTGTALKEAYRSADVLVHPSRSETYGMVVTEALAHGLPVIAAAAGGLPDALGRTPDGTRPGILVPPGDASQLTAALRAWLTSADLRQRVRLAALARRSTLPSWSTTTAKVARVLTAAAA